MRLNHIFPQVLGDRFTTLPEAIQATHMTVDQSSWQGRASVQRGLSLWSRFSRPHLQLSQGLRRHSRRSYQKIDRVWRTVATSIRPSCFHIEAIRDTCGHDRGFRSLYLSDRPRSKGTVTALTSSFRAHRSLPDPEVVTPHLRGEGIRRRRPFQFRCKAACARHP